MGIIGGAIIYRKFRHQNPEKAREMWWVSVMFTVVGIISLILVELLDAATLPMCPYMCHGPWF